MNFVALDIETANSSPKSVCEVGLVRFESGIETASWSSIVRPKSDSELHPINFGTHGISQEEILAAPYLNEVWDEICEFVDNYPIVAHGATQDLSKLFQSAKSAMNDDWAFPSSEYLCSLVLTRNSKVFGVKSFSLRSLTEHLSLDTPDITRNGLIVHSALTDARASGLIMSELMARKNERDIKKVSESLGVRVGKILNRTITQKAVSESNSRSFKRMNFSDFQETKESLQDSGNFFYNHPLANRAIALTLSLKSLSEKEFALVCAIVDAELKSGVSSKLDFLVEGLDPSGKYEHGKTGKSQKARELISSGKAAITLLGEQEFLDLLGEDVISAAKELSMEWGQESQAARQKKEFSRESRSQKRAEAEIAYKAFIRKPKWDEAFLPVGATVGFTKIYDFEAEERLRSACESAGIQVTKSTSRKLDLLVVEDQSFRDSAKLRDAIQKGIKVCLLSHFLEANPQIASKVNIRSKFSLRKFLPFS